MTEQQYIDLFQSYRKQIDDNSVEGMNKHRDAAFQKFKEIGFPTAKQEDYKHSDVARNFDGDFGLNLRNLEFPIDPYRVFRCDVPNISTQLHFLINDRYHHRSSTVNSFPGGVFIGCMQHFAEKFPSVFNEYYAQIAHYEDNGTVAYNTMFAQDGFVVYVPENTIVEKPLQLINVLRSDVDINVNRRILIIAGKNAQVKLLACDHTVDDVNFVVTQVTEIFAGENAQVDFYELEENSVNVKRFANLFSRQFANSNVITSCITLHNGFTRNNFEFKLLGEHAEAHVGGIAICDKEQHADNYAFLDHAVPNCMSNELFKYSLDERATGAFCGKILVEKDAQKTQAYQNNKNLVISDTAKMFSKPQLEIYADDVKCSHGLTTGQLDQDALFYLRARGISKSEARQMLMVAFMEDVLDLIRIDSLRERLEYLIDRRFRGELLRCGGCFADQ
ncbi:MAG: Fe-S cluster assembly protein SufD [Petrimonas sp.]|nr:Fe-S cluster assembly protein SufD [Petrimonas sp.]